MLYICIYITKIYICCTNVNIMKNIYMLYTCIYVYVYVYMYIWIYVYMYICIYGYMYICIYVYMYICKCICICKCKCICICICISIYIYIRRPCPNHGRGRAAPGTTFGVDVVRAAPPWSNDGSTFAKAQEAPLPRPTLAYPGTAKCFLMGLETDG